jgi:malonate decarboxylase delta subunit
MEKFIFQYPVSEKIERIAHVGVVGSGELEILVEPNENNLLVIEVRTGVVGFEDTWKKVIDRFAQQNQVAATIKINDFGATPGVVAIRLAQAMEVSLNGTTIS